MHSSTYTHLQEELSSDMAVYGKQHQQQAQPSALRSFIRWVQLKNYQYEVTFSLYMLTQREKHIFNFILVSLVSMIFAAAFLYLPNHMSIIYSRLWYYVEGSTVSTTVVAAVKTTKAVLSYSTPGVVAQQSTQSILREL